MFVESQKKNGEFVLRNTDGSARCGTFTTVHGDFQTPAFMPVGTQGTVKGMTPDRLVDIGAEIILSNTYHLHLRPGEELIYEAGGIHRFMGWQGPILTDSGGYQVFSLTKLRTVSNDGVMFQSHLDGKAINFTPERVIQIQERLGVDIAMVLDECCAYPLGKEEVSASLQRTLSWARRSLEARRREETSCFGIVQGGMYPELRDQAVREMMKLPFDGYAIGGVSVGEPVEVMREIAKQCAQLLPVGKIRYLMGVGTPEDIVHAVSYGIDLFDCVIPTRSARFGRLYTQGGYLNIRNSEYRNDHSAIDSKCDCMTCRTFSRAYLSHLVHAKEVLAIELATVHNLRFYQRLMAEIRQAISEKRFSLFAKEFLANRNSEER